jgi:hypothetical protein
MSYVSLGCHKVALVGLMFVLVATDIVRVFFQVTGTNLASSDAG